MCWHSEIASVPEEHGVEEYRFNDGKISPAGVFIGGRMHSTGDRLDGKHSHWYRLEWHKEQKNSRLVQVSQSSSSLFYPRSTHRCVLLRDTAVTHRMCMCGWSSNGTSLRLSRPQSAARLCLNMSCQCQVHCR